MLLHSSSPLSLPYSTPSRSSYYSARSHQPLNSSPLASSSCVSPTHHVQQRRRSQYKSVTPTSSRSSAVSPSTNLLFRSANQTPEEPQKALLRERFQAQCRAHAQKLRQHAVNARRTSGTHSDIFMECDDDDDESDDVVMQDELFRRIVQNTKHKKTHSYRVSYALEVGSSFDPDLEDPAAWESELLGQTSSGTEPTPDDWEEEFDEYTVKRAALADFADLDNLDLTADDSDFDKLVLEMPRQTPPSRDVCPTSEMDMS